ncbi:Armc4 [Acrasis kona]|uniref:Armc4 n=1 Tax=Acrasis kona TaxID=1008807 RepID=A0AAW2ZDY2_9EUKA
MYENDIVKCLNELLNLTCSSQLLVNCLDTLGIVSEDATMLRQVINNGGMRKVWSMLRSDFHEVQVAAARAVCNCINNPESAGVVGQMFVGGFDVLIRLVSSSRKSQVIGYCNLVMAKMATNKQNRVVLSESGVLKMLSDTLLSSRDRFVEILSLMGSKPTNQNETEELFFAEVQFETVPLRRKMILTCKEYNDKLLSALFVFSNTAIAIGELCKHGSNRYVLHQLGALEPLVDCLSYLSFVQQHFDANHHRNEFDNAAMVEIMGRHQIVLEGSAKTKMSDEEVGIVTNPDFDDNLPFVCKSKICSPSSLDKSFSRDLDCYYHHVFRNATYALSQLSEDETVADKLRLCNSVSIMVRLLNSNNDALQVSAAKTISNIRKRHCSDKM